MANEARIGVPGPERLDLLSWVSVAGRVALANLEAVSIGLIYGDDVAAYEVRLGWVYGPAHEALTRAIWLAVDDEWSTEAFRLWLRHRQLHPETELA